MPCPILLAYTSSKRISCIIISSHSLSFLRSRLQRSRLIHFPGRQKNDPFVRPCTSDSISIGLAKVHPPPIFSMCGVGGGRTFLKMRACRFGGYFRGVFSLPIPKNPQNFLRSRLRRSRVTFIPRWQGARAETRHS